MSNKKICPKCGEPYLIKCRPMTMPSGDICQSFIHKYTDILGGLGRSVEKSCDIFTKPEWSAEQILEREG